MKILVINCGSSSIKYRLFDMGDQQELARGVIERIGAGESEVIFQCGQVETRISEPIANYEAGVRCLLNLLTRGVENPPLDKVNQIDGIGHRVVHGGEGFYDSVVIDDQVVETIESFCELAPLHNPGNLAGIQAAMRLLPGKPQVAVFDTAFFQTMPAHAFTYALPWEWYTERRIRRYGFHGTSHKYVASVAAELLNKPDPNLITMHLGNGCSVTCIRQGQAVDQSMGLTPLEGLVMGTRCGDIDPAIVFHLNRCGMKLEEIREAMENRGGLLGISGVSNDLRDIQESAQRGNQRAALAVEVFAYRARKYLGAYLAALGTCDALVFTGGIGEGADFMRARILDGLAPLGIKLDPQLNTQQVSGPICISTKTSRTAIWVIPTNEELMIARDTMRLLGQE